MELRWVETVLTVAETGSLTAAAERLHLTQPAVTRQLHVLERELGCRLLDRGRFGAELTPAGRELLPELRALLQQERQLRDRAEAVASGRSGRLSVGFGMTSFDIAPAAVAEFRRRYPEVDIALEDLSSATQVERLRSGRLDVGFVRLPAGPGVDSLIVGSERLAWVQPSQARTGIARAATELRDGRPSRMTDIVNQFATIVLDAERAPGITGQIDRFCAALGAQPTWTQHPRDSQSILALVAAGSGCALLPSGVRRMKPDGVTLTPLDHPAATWDIALVWPSRGRSTPAANFVDLVTADRTGR